MYSAIIGCGNIGFLYDRGKGAPPLTHSSAYKTHPNFELIAVSDTDTLRGQDCANELGTAFYENYEDLITQIKPDVVSVCTPHQVPRLPLLRFLIEQGVKIIICEKPLSFDLVELDEINELLTNNDCILHINYLRRWSPDILELKKQSSDWGHVSSITANYNRGFKNFGSHLLDLILFLLNGKDFELDSLTFRERDEDDFNIDIDFKTVFKGGKCPTNFKFIQGLDYPIFELNLFFEKVHIKIDQGLSVYTVKPGAGLIQTEAKRFIGAKSFLNLLNNINKKDFESALLSAKAQTKLINQINKHCNEHFTC